MSTKPKEQPKWSPCRTLARTQGFNKTSGRPHLGRSAHKIPPLPFGSKVKAFLPYLKVLPSLRGSPLWSCSRLISTTFLTLFIVHSIGIASPSGSPFPLAEMSVGNGRTWFNLMWGRYEECKKLLRWTDSGSNEFNLSSIPDTAFI